MSIEEQNSDLTVDAIRQKLDDYRTTIQALQSCVSEFTWNFQTQQRLFGSQDSLGRRMSTSPSNRIAPSTEVTPDAVIQRNKRVGYVVEAKKSLPNNQRYWQRITEQLAKYDDVLIGWWTEDENISTQCVVLLLEISRVTEFCSYLNDLKAKDTLPFDQLVSVVEFTRADELKKFIWLRLMWGGTEDEDVASSLNSGVKVPIEDVLADYGERKFYDSKPIAEHTMYILWQDLFNVMKSEVEYNQTEKAYLLEVNLGDLTEELQRLYGSSGAEHREVRFPKTQWVREAMEAFVKLNLARRAENGQHYTVYFKRVTGDLIERFAKHRTRVSREPVATQLKLFETDANKEL